MLLLSISPIDPERMFGVAATERAACFRGAALQTASAFFSRGSVRPVGVYGGGQKPSSRRCSRLYRPILRGAIFARPAT